MAAKVLHLRANSQLFSQGEAIEKLHGDNEVLLAASRIIPSIVTSAQVGMRHGEIRIFGHGLFDKLNCGLAIGLRESLAVRESGESFERRGGGFGKRQALLLYRAKG